MILYYLFKKTVLYLLSSIILLEFNKTSKIFIKKSDTIFILGSGSTINEINEKQWKNIKKHSTIGFNYFMFHNFIPDSYLIEPERVKDLLLCKNLINLIKKKKKYLSKTKIIMHRMGCYKIIKYCLKNYSIDFKLFTPFDFGFKTNIQIKKFLNSSLIKFSNYFFLPAQGCASVERIVLSAYLHGFKNIVLCGVDLNNNEYFFYKKTKYENELKKNAQIIKIFNKKHHAKNIHATNDVNKAKKGIAVSEILKIYNAHFKKNNVNLFVLNKKSALSKFLPIYNFKLKKL